MKFDLSRWRMASPFISRETKCHLNENLPEISLFLNLLPISLRKCFHQEGLVILGKGTNFRSNCRQVEQEFPPPPRPPFLTFAVAFEFWLEIGHQFEFENGSFPQPGAGDQYHVLRNLEGASRPTLVALCCSAGLTAVYTTSSWFAHTTSPRWHLPARRHLSSQSVRKLVWVEGREAVSSPVPMAAT